MNNSKIGGVIFIIVGLTIGIGFTVFHLNQHYDIMTSNCIEPEEIISEKFTDNIEKLCNNHKFQGWVLLFLGIFFGVTMTTIGIKEVNEK